MRKGSLSSEHSQRRDEKSRKHIHVHAAEANALSTQAD